MQTNLNRSGVRLGRLLEIVNKFGLTIQLGHMLTIKVKVHAPTISSMYWLSRKYGSLCFIPLSRMKDNVRNHRSHSVD